MFNMAGVRELETKLHYTGIKCEELLQRLMSAGYVVEHATHQVDDVFARDLDSLRNPHEAALEPSEG